MSKPNFLIVGAAKSGSTSLYHYLKQHPEVFMPENKEPNYFVGSYQKTIVPSCPTWKNLNRRIVLDSESYYRLFEKAVPQTHKAIGEASVTYLFKPKVAIPRIKKELGDPYILIILRNPVDRCVSQYQYCREFGWEGEEIKEALALEKSRLDEGWSSIFAYVEQGMYSESVKMYLDSFTNVKVLLLDDFVADKQGQMSDIYKFLEIAPGFVNDFSEKLNTSGLPRWRGLHNLIMREGALKNVIRSMLRLFGLQKRGREFLRALRQMNQRPGRIDVPADVRQDLRETYKSDVAALGQVLRREDIRSVWS
ncbi:MAG: hypothetical protein CMK38_06915 [Porticoccaceae bacterium]|nr:hypothetical protein [Porticoccaceae bacterium]